MKRPGLTEADEVQLRKPTVVRCLRCPDFAVTVSGADAAEAFRAHVRFAHRDTAETT